MNTLNAPQPPPASDDAGPEVWPALLAEVSLSPELRALCEERDAMGRAKYGTALRVHNGREPLVAGDAVRAARAARRLALRGLPTRLSAVAVLEDLDVVTDFARRFLP